MTDRLLKVSFLASGHVEQDILITAANVSAERLVEMLNSGDAATTIIGGEDVCVTTGDWETIGIVSYVEPSLEYSMFELEDEYTLVASPPEIFDATRLARAGAIEEFIFEENMTVDEMLSSLAAYGDAEPLDLAVEEQWQGMSGNKLLKEIDMFSRGLKSLIEVAYEAGKAGKEMV